MVVSILPAMNMQRTPAIHHCTPTPTRFVGRAAELALLDRALVEPSPSVVAMVGPGGQGKTAIVQHWLSRLRISDFGLQIESQNPESAIGNPQSAIFLWSFY